MARTRTLAELRAEVRARADIENDPHVTDTEVDRFVNQSIARLHNLVVQASEDDFVTSQALNTVATQQAYALAAAFFKLISVEATISGQVRRFDRFTWAERARYLNVNTWGVYGQPLSYRLVGNDSIQFLPVPDAVYPVTIWYVPSSTVLAADASTYDGRDGWEEWVVLDSAIKCKLKSEEDIRDLSIERERLMVDINAAFATKDQGQPDRVQDTKRARRGWVY